eukprot:910159-Rhodomonas_salina.1
MPCTALWAAACVTDSPLMSDDWEALADLDSLEPDPSNWKQAMSSECLCPFWLGAEKKEVDWLWSRGCFEGVKQSELPKGTQVFGSRFHYKIKLHTDTMQVKSTKVRLVVQGQRMEQGVDFEDTFSSYYSCAHADGAGGRQLHAPTQP